MGTIRTSKRSERGARLGWFAAVALAGTPGLSVGCAAAAPVPAAPFVAPTPEVASRTSELSRQPDGVVLEPAPAVPEADDRASATGGVVALRPPLATEAVTTIVHRLFRAFAREDLDALQSTLTEDATVLGLAHGATERRPLLEQWRGRLKNLDYTRLAGQELVQESKIERFTFDDLGVSGAPARPPEMKRGELLVRFPVPTPRVGSEQLFGEVMTLLLRRDGRGYKIAAFGEDDPP